jgi:hypothetical protein
MAVAAALRSRNPFASYLPQAVADMERRRGKLTFGDAQEGRCERAQVQDRPVCELSRS